MRSVPGHITDLTPFSSVDGPGNRFIVFLQGCNFDCIACHNPHTIAECDSCGECVAVCPEGALSVEPREGLVVLDAAICTHCDICVEACPYDSTPLAGHEPVLGVLEQIRAAAPFISGVTVSGGEPTLQPNFLVELLSTLKGEPSLSHLTTLVDSNGSAPREVWDRLHPVLDGAMIDLKALDDDVHRRLTGSSNGSVLESIEYLNATDRLHEVRMLMIPGRNDDAGMVARSAEWLAALGGVRVRLIPFRRHGVRPAFAGIDEPSEQQMELHRAILAAAGLEVVGA